MRLFCPQILFDIFYPTFNFVIQYFLDKPFGDGHFQELKKQLEKVKIGLRKNNMRPAK